MQKTESHNKPKIWEQLIVGMVNQILELPAKATLGRYFQ